MSQTLEPEQQQSLKTKLCQGCDLHIASVEVSAGRSAYCPRCGTQLYRGGSPSLNGNLAIAITCLLLFIPSHFFDFISIRLFGVMIPATLPSGIFTLFEEGFVSLAVLVFFCSSIAPLIMCLSVVLTHIGLTYRSFNTVKYSLWCIHHLKHWVMIDVFLVSVAISCFKLQDYSDIYVKPGLIGLIALQIFTVMLLCRVSIRRYWEAWCNESSYDFADESLHCHSCHLSQPDNPEHRCVRCHAGLEKRKANSLQKTWAYLIAASIAVLPANLLPISILITNGERLEDTIFSGVASLVVNDMPFIAAIIFIASIVVPVGKIMGLAYLLITIHLKHRKPQCPRSQRHRMKLFFFVSWIGKWSMMDLFVISIMMTLVDRGQILDFTPGFGAIAFAAVVVLTMLAAENLDPRLLWSDNRDPEPVEQHN
ncbi:PqiA/YebS family transporter subunit [Vibrio sp. WXL210]|uniref:PqiA/YebS family transporter subunit n=1 Tax=Vibrio sp. WXL210 TaxID=3450709 RepID=UPI003EC4EA72